MKSVFKTFLLLLCILLFVASFSSCGNNSEKISENITEYLVKFFSMTKDEKLADASMAKIKKHINAKDAETFKGLFSKNVIAAEENLDEQIKNLFEMLPNGIVEYTLTGDGGSSDGWEYSREYYEIIRKFTVSDGTYQYALVLEECIKDTANKDEVGISLILFYKSEDEDLFDDWFYSDNYDGNRTGVVVYSSNK